MKNKHMQKRSQKTVGVLSFPGVVNHGGYLQAYALIKVLKQAGYTVKYINYRNATHLRNEYRALFMKKKLGLIFYNILRYFTFKKAQVKLGLMGKITSNVKKLNTKKFDYIIVGSDIVWNYETPFLGHDKIYFGHDLNCERIISYAPSFGNSNVAGEIPDYVQSGLSENFQKLSVRDQNSADILKKLGLKSNIVLDPTLLYDFDEEVANRTYNEKYILIYAFSIPHKDQVELQDFARINKLKIVSICFNDRYSWCDRNIMVVDPLDFLFYYKNASYVYTSTFHGVLFSINFDRNFAFRNNDTVAPKVETILRELKLENRQIDGSISQCFETTINYDIVKTKLKPLRESSKNYLLSALI
ncbi:polysaccharide pyruvyl transferase family protein [Planktomarina temperata]|nr:polysaccharide pyruvyl transferase family protein [Planktomarina temperata]